MANVNMKPASGGARYNHSFNPLTIASLDYGELVPMRVINAVKSEDYNQVDGKGFLRLAPLDFPAYGRAYLKSNAFFVPLYQLIDYADAFRSGQTLWHGKDTTRPGIMSHEIMLMLAGETQSIRATDLSTIVGDYATTIAMPDENEFDFFLPITSSSGTINYRAFKLTQKGRRYYKVLCGLGYDFRGYIESDARDTSISTGNINLDALRIIAYAKIYCDYFMNIHMYNSSGLVALLQAIREGNDYTPDEAHYFYQNHLLTRYGLRYILDNILLPWKSNGMYMNAWNTLNDPIGVSGVNTKDPNGDSPVSFIIPKGSSSYLSSVQSKLSVDSNSVSENILYNLETQGNMVALNQYNINTLYAFYQFVRRNKLFGSEAAKQQFARLGIKGNDFDSYFVRKLFEGSETIDFSAVMSNANTVDPDSPSENPIGNYLGSYAGAGLSSLDFNYNYKCVDYGFIIHLAYIQFDAMLLYGFDPMVLKKHYLDYWTPEFDGQAQRAIPESEITYAKYPTSASVQGNDTTPFGYTNIYEEYRQMRDLILGDFRIGFAKNYAFARDLSYYRRGRSSAARFLLQPQTNRMQYFSRDGDNGEFSEVFQFGPSVADRFYLQIVWNISKVSPVKSESEALDLNGTGDLQLSTDSNPA